MFLQLLLFGWDPSRESSHALKLTNPPNTHTHTIVPELHPGLFFFFSLILQSTLLLSRWGVLTRLAASLAGPLPQTQQADRAPEKKSQLPGSLALRLQPALYGCCLLVKGLHVESGLKENFCLITAHHRSSRHRGFLMWPQETAAVSHFYLGTAIFLPPISSQQLPF